MHNIRNQQFPTLWNAHHDKYWEVRGFFNLKRFFLSPAFLQRPLLPLLKLKSDAEWPVCSPKFLCGITETNISWKPSHNSLKPKLPISWSVAPWEKKKNDMKMNKITYQPSNELLTKAEKELYLLMARVPNHMVTNHVFVCSYELFRINCKPI